MIEVWKSSCQTYTSCTLSPAVIVPGKVPPTPIDGQTDWVGLVYKYLATPRKRLTTRDKAVKVANLVPGAAEVGAVADGGHQSSMLKEKQGC